MLGDPVAGEPGAIGFLREGNGRGDGIARRLIGAYGDKVKDGEFQRRHVGVNTRRRRKLPIDPSAVGDRDDV